MSLSQTDSKFKQENNYKANTKNAGSQSIDLSSLVSQHDLILFLIQCNVILSLKSCYCPRMQHILNHLSM